MRRFLSMALGCFLGVFLGAGVMYALLNDRPLNDVTLKPSSDDAGVLIETAVPPDDAKAACADFVRTGMGYRYELDLTMLNAVAAQEEDGTPSIKVTGGFYNPGDPNRTPIAFTCFVNSNGVVELQVPSSDTVYTPQVG